MPTQTSTARIIKFPLPRVRPGVRQRLHALRRDILLARDEGTWPVSESQVTPELIAGMVPELCHLYKMDDIVLAELTIQVTILGLHAIQGKDWDAEDLRDPLLELQHAARLLETAAAQKATETLVVKAVTARRTA
jgi:hypothetical protein